MLLFEFFSFFFFDQKKVAADLPPQLWFFFPFHSSCVCHKLCVALCMDDIWEVAEYKCWDFIKSYGSEFGPKPCYLPTVP